MNENGVYIAIIGLLRIEFSELNTMLFLARKISNKWTKKLISEIIKIDLSILFFDESLMNKSNILFFKTFLYKIILQSNAKKSKSII